MGEAEIGAAQGEHAVGPSGDRCIGEGAAGGKMQRSFAMWVPAGDMPALAYGPDAVDQLAARFGADPSRVVVGSLRNIRVALRAPAALNDPERVNEVIIHRARQTLERAGVAPGSISLIQDRPWQEAAAGAPPR